MFLVGMALNSLDSRFGKCSRTGDHFIFPFLSLLISIPRSVIDKRRGKRFGSHC